MQLELDEVDLVAMLVAAEKLPAETEDRTAIADALTRQIATWIGLYNLTGRNV